MTRPLDGCAVIDVSQSVTGAYAAMILADLGAEVLKIEPPGGDPCRRIGKRRSMMRDQPTGLAFAGIMGGTPRSVASCTIHSSMRIPQVRH